MRLRVAVVVLSFLCAVGCGDDRPRLVAFGHSIVQGEEKASPDRPWPERVAAKLGRQDVNLGRSGAEAPTVLNAVEKYEPKRGDVAVVEVGINEVRRNGAAGAPNYQRTVLAILRRLVRELGASRVVFAFDAPPTKWRNTAFTKPPYDHGSASVLALYRAAAKRATRAVGVPMVDLGRGWQADQVADTLHPNDRGTQRVADVIAAALRRHSAASR